MSLIESSRAVSLPLNMLVFQDKGANYSSVQGIVEVLKCYFPQEAHVEVVNADYIRKKNWEDQTDLIALPGGEFSEMHSVLSDEGLLKIHQYVERGGKCIAICGSAFGFSRSSRFLCGEIPPRENSSWAFFEGQAIGPIYGEKDYRSKEGFHASEIKLEQGGEGCCYYQGGSAFKLESDSNVEVVARYNDFVKDSNSQSVLQLLEDRPPAIIIKEKSFVMMGCHPEVDLHPFTKVLDEEVQSVASRVFSSGELRESIWKVVFSKLDLRRG